MLRSFRNAHSTLPRLTVSLVLLIDVAAFCAPPAQTSPMEDSLFPEDLLETSSVEPDEDHVEYFERQIFGGTEGITPARRRARGEERLYISLDQRCQQLQQRYGFTQDQVDKLRLAGRGDIQRFLRDVESARSEYVQPGNNLRAQAEQRLATLRARANGGVLCGSSLFASVLRGIMHDSSQSTSDELAARQAFARTAQLEQAVAYLERRVPLVQHQRETLLSLLAAAESKTTAETSSSLPAPLSIGHQEILEILIKLPEEVWSPHFSEDQWTALRQESQKGLRVIGR